MIWGVNKHFDTLSAALDAAKTHPEWGKRYAQADDQDGRWSGGTYTEAEHMVRYGWTEGAAIASERARRVVDRVVSTGALALSYEIANDVAGACFDVGAYVSGEPECWVRPAPVYAKRAIHICTHQGANAGIPTETIRARGIAVASLALALNAAGHPVTIDVTYTHDRAKSYAFANGSKLAAATVRVADASTGSPLDVDRVVYAMAHPTMLRLIFRALIADKDVGYAWDCGQCQTSTPPTDTKYDLFMAGLHYNDDEYTRDPEGWVTREYARLTNGGA